MASSHARRSALSLLARSSRRISSHTHQTPLRQFTQSSIRLVDAWNSEPWEPPTSNTASKPTKTSSRTVSSSTKPTTSSTTTPRTITPSFTPASTPPPPTARTETLATETAQSKTTQSLTDGLSDSPTPTTEGVPSIDWSSSYHGLGGAAFTPEQHKILLAPILEDDVEVKPDGLIYLPEIKYRRILNRAFGPGAWGLVPRGETIVTAKLITREYGLIVEGRLVSIARGEQQYFDPDGIPTATEGCKSNALMRCCKDLGIASELWDPRFIRRFLNDMTKEIWVEHVVNKRKKKIVIRKDDTVRPPFKESKF